jgi:di/tricarboxylate transporter
VPQSYDRAGGHESPSDGPFLKATKHAGARHAGGVPLAADRSANVRCPAATGPSPVHYGSGYLPSNDDWKLGAIFGLLFIGVMPVIALPWLALVR